MRGHRPSFLFYGVGSGDLDLVALLLDLGADVNVHDGESNLLALAMKIKKYEMVKLLVHRGATGGGQPLMHYAILRDAPIEILQLLVDLGYGPWSVGLVPPYHETAMEYARRRNKIEAIKFLEEFE